MATRKEVNHMRNVHTLQKCYLVRAKVFREAALKIMR